MAGAAMDEAAAGAGHAAAPAKKRRRSAQAPAPAADAAGRLQARRRRADRVLSQAAAAVRADALSRSKQTQMVTAQPAGRAFTLQELQSDVIVALAERTWGPSAPEDAPFDPEIVDRLYARELAGRRGHEGARRAQVLELSQYLERYLWPHFDAAAASDAHVMSIVALVNEKFRDGVPAWDAFVPENTPGHPDKWRAFVSRVLALAAGGLAVGGRPMAPPEAEQYLRFVIHLFQSLEAPHVRDAVLPLASIPLWHALHARRREVELLADARLAKKWRAMGRREAKEAAAAKAEGREFVPQAERPEATFLPTLVDHFLAALRTVVVPPGAEVKTEATENGAAAVGETGGESDSESDEEEEAAAATASVMRLEDLPDGGGGGEDAAPGEATNGETPTSDGAPPALDDILPATGADAARAARPRRDAAGVDRPALRFCERFLELLTDLLSQLPTRRFLHAVLCERQVLVKAKRSALYAAPAGQLFRQLLDQFEFYVAFPVDNHTSEALQELDLDKRDDEAVLQFQRLLFKHWPALRDVALTNCASVRKPETLREALSPLSLEELRRLAVTQLRLVAPDDADVGDAGFLRDAILAKYVASTRPKAAIAAMPLYPTETLLWDENQIPDIHYAGDACLALPKLNLQFLSFWDYLLRNFNLFRLEAAYEIREDVGDVLKRLQPTRHPGDGGAVFNGWSRMAARVASFTIVEVARPAVGDTKPASVTAELTYDLAAFRRFDVRDEWDELKEHDVVFLLSVQPPSEEERAAMAEEGIAATAGLRYLRGAEVIEIRDAEGQLFNDFRGRVKLEDAPRLRKGTRRTLLLALDPAQYQIDVDTLEPDGAGAARKAETGARGVDAIYAGFNVVQRRKAKENNFKAVLESIRDLMTEDAAIPEWMHDLFLGYGDPADAQYPALDGTHRHLDMRDTILDAAHLRDAFPDYSVIFRGGSPDDSAPPAPPFQVTFPRFSADPELTPEPLPEGVEEAPEGTLVARGYTPEKSTPFPQLQPGQNAVRFNKAQLQVIVSALQPGLTMCVGPPGTGKTDTAVQALTLLYHNFPGQRALVVAHSNQALNDVFQKTIERDVPPRYLLRLGMGQEELATDVDFSRTGRVNAMLQRRIDLLAQVTTLAQQLGEADDAGYTCETAGYFYLLHVLGRWERFLAAVASAAPDDGEAVRRLFPFTDFFAEAPPPLFRGESVEADMAAARVCWAHLQTMFRELEECRAFELLKGQADRVNYLVTKHAKVVAMTCTHAALKRRDFLRLGFRYDTLLMEESAQILEIETLIPMLLQAPQDGHNRLKRIILIGDHHQLPPVVKNQAFQKYSRLDQPLFTRLIRLGTPYYELSAQGRARPAIAQLYNWRYRALGDLPHVRTEERFLRPNAGFAHEYQFVDVAPCRGPGESAPSPYFYQNVDEAEFVVRTFMLMRLLGYPADRVTLLTTYNGQKALLEDVVRRHCEGNPLFGAPAKIATVDKYQGQQNDYVLLSLVRTRTVGHLRDVRRLVVATSRARLGLYVFGCRALFEQCHELAPTFGQLLARPTQLQLQLGERWGQPVERGGADAAAAAGAVTVVSLPHMEGLVQGVADRVAAEAAHAAALAQHAAAAAAAPPGAAPAAAPTDAAPGADAEMAAAAAGDAAPAAAVPGPRPPSGPPPPLAPGTAPGALPGLPAPPPGMVYVPVAAMPPPHAMYGVPPGAYMPPQALPPGAFVVPQFVVQAPVAAPPGEVTVGEPLKRGKKGARGRGRGRGGAAGAGRKSARAAASTAAAAPADGGSGDAEMRASDDETGAPAGATVADGAASAAAGSGSAGAGDSAAPSTSGAAAAVQELSAAAPAEAAAPAPAADANGPIKDVAADAAAEAPGDPPVQASQEVQEPEAAAAKPAKRVTRSRAKVGAKGKGGKR